MFNGLVLGALLALISSGLTIIYGTLGVLNLAHGAMFMIGGYAGFLAYDATGSFLLAVVSGALSVMVLGIVMERVIIRHFYGRPNEDQILVTFGIGIVLVEMVRLGFGSLSVSVPTPSWATGIVHMGFLFYPTYRIAALVIAVHLAGKANAMTAFWAMAFFWLRLAHAIARLPEDQRRAVELHYLKGLAVAEVAEEIGRTRPAAVGLLFRGLKRLREMLRDSGDSGHGP